MERIKLAQVDIDVDALIEKSAEARKRLLEISNEMKSLKDTLDKGNISIDEYAKRLTVLTAEQKIQSNELRVYDNLVKGHIETEAKKTQSNKKVSGSIKELGAALSQNKLIYQQLSEEEREAADVGGKLLAVIQEQDKKYKELQKSIGNNQVDVGNYRQAILDAMGTNSDLGASLNSLTNGFTTLKDKLALVKAPFENYIKYGKLSAPTMEQMSNATNKSATSLKILRGAVISTGIGALVVALGSLIAYFTSTQEGID